jgi:hypothetical protein
MRPGFSGLIEGFACTDDFSFTGDASMLLNICYADQLNDTNNLEILFQVFCLYHCAESWG